MEFRAWSLPALPALSIGACAVLVLLGLGALTADPARASVWYGPGTGTPYQLEPGLDVVDTTSNISPLDRTASANLVVNGDMTDNGHANTTPYRWSPTSTNSLSGVAVISAASGSPLARTMPGWTFTGGGTNTYALWLPGTSAAVGPWGNGLTQWGPYGSKNGASNPQLYFGNDEGWTISPLQTNANFTAQGVTQTALTWTPGSPATTARNLVNGIAPTASQTVTTTVSDTYCLSFWVGHESFGATVGSRPAGIARVQITGYNDVFFKVPTLIGAAGERWYTFQFEAKSTATRLAFTSWGHLGSASSSSTELVLDDVVVNSCSPPPTPVAVGDVVWNDVNGNGIQDAGEPGVSGVQVQLLKPDGTIATDINGTAVASVTTDALGAYLIDNLAPGSYKAQFTLPSGYVLTVPSAAAGTSATDSNPAPTSNPLVGVTPVFTIAGSATGDTTAVSGNPQATFANLTIDAGIVQPVAVGDFVWLDANRDGVQDVGEASLAGVVVELLTTGGLPAVDAQGNPVASVTTDAQGAYLFDNLLPGTYTAGFTLPQGMTFSPTGNGTSATDSNATAGASWNVGTTAPFVIAAIATGDTAAVSGNPRAMFANLTVDVGVVPLVGVGNFVWVDANGDGVQDAGEAPLAGVVVELLTAGGLPATDAAGNAVASVTTDAQGAYFFGGLAPGTYMVRFTLPSGATFAPTGAGSSASDSDAVPGVNLTVGTTAPFTISASATGDTTALSGNSSAAFANLTIDAGVIMPASSGTGAGSGTGSGGTTSGTDSTTPPVITSAPSRGATTTSTRPPASIPSSAIDVNVLSTSAYAAPGDQVGVTVQVENTSSSTTPPMTIALVIPPSVRVTGSRGAVVVRGTATWHVGAVRGGKTISKTLKVTATTQGPVRFSAVIKAGKILRRVTQAPLTSLPDWVSGPSRVTG